MSTEDLTRRRDLLSRRLKEQMGTFNRGVLLQVVNYAFFILVILPLVICGILFLLGHIFYNAAKATKTEMFVDLSHAVGSFIMHDQIFHIAMVILAVVILSLMALHFFNTQIRLTSAEMKLAGFLLAKLGNNEVMNFKTIHKEIEFRNLTYQQIQHVAVSLKRLNHALIEEKDALESNIFIKTSEW